MNTLKNGFPQQIFGVDDFLGLRNDFFSDRLRNDEHSVAITSNVVSRLDLDGPDLDRNIIVYEPPATYDVSGVV